MFYGVWRGGGGPSLSLAATHSPSLPLPAEGAGLVVHPLSLMLDQWRSVGGLQRKAQTVAGVLR